MEFHCRVALPSGEVTEGVYTADNETRLRREFEEKGLCLLTLKPAGFIGHLSIPNPRRASIKTPEFLIFNQELATLLKAGMPLVQSLKLLKGRVPSATLRNVLDDVYEKVRAGSALSDAFAAHAALLPSVYTASLLAGERSGSLDTVLRRFVEHSKIIETVRRKTFSALMYPAILLTLALVLVSIIVLNVIPAFADFYATFDAQLPFLTRVIVAISTFISERLWFLVTAIALAVVLLVSWLSQPGQRARFDRALLKVPMLGEVARKFATTQMARTLATLLQGGLPLVNAIDIASRSVGNRYLAGELAAVGIRVREGMPFAQSLEERRAFPDVAVRMAEVGESTGALQEMLNAVADFFDEDITVSLERFVTLVEPTLLIVLGVVIAGLLLALYLPLFQLSSVLS